MNSNKLHGFFFNPIYWLLLCLILILFSVNQIISLAKTLPNCSVEQVYWQENQEKTKQYHKLINNKDEKKEAAQAVTGLAEPLVVSFVDACKPLLFKLRFWFWIIIIWVVSKAGTSMLDHSIKKYFY